MTKKQWDKQLAITVPISTLSKEAVKQLKIKKLGEYIDKHLKFFN